MKQTVEFFFDFVSPYSYLAYSQLDSLPADTSLRPMHVLSVMKAVGNTPTTVTCATPTPISRAGRAVMVSRSIARTCAR